MEPCNNKDCLAHAPKWPGGCMERPDIDKCHRYKSLTAETDGGAEVACIAGLCWGQKKPTIPGFYWYKSKTDKPYIGHVKSPDDGWVKKRNGEWAGPIPEPTT